MPAEMQRFDTWGGVRQRNSQSDLSSPMNTNRKSIASQQSQASTPSVSTGNSYINLELQSFPW